MKRILIFATLIFSISIAVCGQEKKNESNAAPTDDAHREGLIERRIIVNGAPLPPSNTFVFGMSFGKIVKGAPYSAEAVTESVQTLADGNRITHKTTAKLYRDSEGRTRREQSALFIAPYSVAGDIPQTILINDPVAGFDYILEPKNRTAMKHATPQFLFDKRNNSHAESSDDQLIIQQKIEKDEKINVLATPTIGNEIVLGINQSYAPREKPKIESLGTRIIEGVQAEGKRITFTIPAGEIGNEQPINIVDERWYSPELQLMLMTKHSDPRTGETVYRLTNINRSEPDASLFQPPPDYTVREFGAGAVKQMRMRKPTEEKNEKKN